MIMENVKMERSPAKMNTFVGTALGYFIFVV